MGRHMRGENREAKENGRRISVAKVGRTLTSSRANNPELSSAGLTNGMSEAQTEGQDHLHQRIAELAYVLYEQSGFQDGHDLEHWLEAERQVKGVRGQAA